RALAVQRKSEITAAITALTRQRHALLSALKAGARGCLHIDSLQREATLLLQLFKDYGIARSMQINQATGLFTNLMADLEGKYAPLVQSMNLQLYVAGLQTANNRLQELSEARLDVYNSNGTARLASARKQADAAYYQLIRFVEALVLVGGAEAYTALIDRINTEIKHYKLEAVGGKVSEKIPAAE
ncbi:MAG: DUF6261 family protein, partial [Prevotellaceae bacterium]|nr:DUF6261 family protein [Prevotellaceae bacterium]